MHNERVCLQCIGLATIFSSLFGNLWTWRVTNQIGALQHWKMSLRTICMRRSVIRLCFFLQNSYNDCIKVVYIHVSITPAVRYCPAVGWRSHRKDWRPNFYNFLYNRRYSEDVACNCNAWRILKYHSNITQWIHMTTLLYIQGSGVSSFVQLSFCCENWSSDLIILWIESTGTLKRSDLFINWTHYFSLLCQGHFNLSVCHTKLSYDFRRLGIYLVMCPFWSLKAWHFYDIFYT